MRNLWFSKEGKALFFMATLCRAPESSLHYPEGSAIRMASSSFRALVPSAISPISQDPCFTTVITHLCKYKFVMSRTKPASYCDLAPAE